MPKFQTRSKRKQGVILSLVGWQRLQDAQKHSEKEANGKHPYTLKDLNELTGLSSARKVTVNLDMQQATCSTSFAISTSI